VIGPRRAQSTPVFLRNLGRDALTALAQIALSVTFLAFHAVDSLHAIGLTLVRLGVTRRRLLEWETAATVAARTMAGSPRGRLNGFVRGMIASPITATTVALVILAGYRNALPVATPFLLLWLSAPVIAYRLSVPVGRRVRPLSTDDRTLLRTTARATWRYFDTFVTAADHQLPPDNFQESGDVPMVARRTSPTNIGMSLLSALAAHDLGYLTTAALLERVDGTLTTLEGLERDRGHFLNWYHTVTLAPLHPRYISTVDSGNLAGALYALSQGMLAVAAVPQTTSQRRDGVADAAALLAAASASTAAHPGRLSSAEINRLARAIVDEAGQASTTDAVPALRALGLQLAGSAADGVDDPPAATSGDIAYWRRAVLDGIDSLDGPTPDVTAQCEALQ